MSFSLHSSSGNLGGGRRSGSDGSYSSSRLSWPVKSSIGLMSANASARPLSKNHRKESRWMAMRSGNRRTSSRLANEKRSGLLDREGNGRLLPGGWRAVGKDGRRTGRSPAGRGGVATGCYTGRAREVLGTITPAPRAQRRAPASRILQGWREER